MAKTIEDIENELRSLSADDRMHLLRELIADLDEAMDEDVEKKHGLMRWSGGMRYKELKEGEVELIPAAGVFFRARARLKR